ncbi:MAG: orc1/cdc6 family replication initiation protein, partial [Clostridia bacterium]|nr:orc1/cdc6 family replication initiation protein [Clostridia bacterium]
HEWIGLMNRQTSGDVSEAQQRCCGQLRELLPQAVEEVGACMQQDGGTAMNGALKVLRDALEEYSAAMNGRGSLDRPGNYYLSLAAEDALIITEDGLPFIFGSSELVEPYEQCRRLDPLADAEREDVKSAAARMTADMIESFNASDCGGNYGNMIQVLNAAFGDDEGQEPYSPAQLEQHRESAEALLSGAKNRFRGQMEMAAAYGWFDLGNEGQAAIEQAALNQCELCGMTQNYSLGFRCLKEAVAWVREQARANWHDLLLGRLQQVMDKHNVEEDNQTVRRIRNLIEQDSYIAADSSLNKADSGGFPEDEMEEQYRSESFEDFLNGYSSYYERTNVIRQELTRAFEHSHVRPTEKRTGSAFLSSWPRDVMTLHKSVRGLLEGMNLKVASISVEGMKDGSHVSVVFQPVARSLDYEHPFANFGTRMFEKGLDVICVPSMPDASGYFDSFRRGLNRSNAQAVLFVVNAALPLADRRQLTSMIWHELHSSRPFIFIDRALALYLAEKPMLQRWNILMQCALPFAHIQPYAASSTVVQPPEMFVGRREELKKIADFVVSGGANIVYGGRQLGKTALLRRVVQRYHDPEANSYAVFCEIKDRDAAQAVPFIVQAMREYDVPGADDIPLNAGWSELCWALRDILHRNRQMQLRLLIDEADVLLSRARLDAYRILDDMKMVQDANSDRFKFVLAGLHNVLRFHEEARAANSSLPKLQHVCVSPLQFSEAEQLLKKPLSYLGFSFDESEQQQTLISMILSTTNYYPGLIHNYCESLLNSIGEGQTILAPQKPPYSLDEKLILRLLQNSRFLEETKDKFLMTIGVDKDEHQYYSILAHLMAYCFMNMLDAKQGVSIDDLRAMAEEVGVTAVTALSNAQLEALMEELCQLNIFRREGKSRYRFERPAFQHMLGDKETVEEQLMRYMDGEEVCS